MVAKSKSRAINSIRRGRQEAFELRQSIGQRVKEASEGMPIARLAEQMGISRQTVYDWI
jgi:DNA invertase Pin-like site-specific DNA recombinase